MKKYYYTDGTSQFGPFDFEDLKLKGISRDTFIWHEGLDGWKKAGEIDELKSLYNLPPLIHQTNKQFVQVPIPQKKTGKLGAQIFSIISIVVSVVITLYGLLLTLTADSLSGSMEIAVLSLGTIITSIGVYFIIYSIVMTVYIRK